MTKSAILVEDLSKRYRIGLKERTSDTMAGSFARMITRPVRNFRRLRRLSTFDRSEVDGEGIIWAIQNISFQIGQGEVVGLVGPNGAGKTTLLKILSRITEPTQGRAIVRGKVSSLLEVGTGFHPELTGRENIYLNGTILGMRKTEIDRKFDEIVSFSGVEKFLDTPVKRFSTGMAVRLAFSVAAHLEPEILLVDEVLAVGDAEFQKKSLGKMKEVTKEGRTVLFVSHNMTAIRNLCERSLFVSQGRLVADGNTDSILGQYLNQGLVQGSCISAENIDQDNIDHLASYRGWEGKGNSVLQCMEVNLSGPNGVPRNEFYSDEEITLSTTYECLESHSDFRIIVSVVDENHAPILTTQNADSKDGSLYYKLEPGIYRSSCVFPANLFGERRFYISLKLVFPHVDRLSFDGILAFDVKFTGYNNISYMNHGDSFIRPKLDWHTTAVTTPTGSHDE